MRCKKHLADYSSAVGVCASCLRERLLSLMAAETQLAEAVTRRNLATLALPISFPRSVSPYVSRRKVDDDGTGCGPDVATWRLHGRRQVGPTGDAVSVGVRKGRGGGMFSSLLLGLFRSKSGNPDSNPASDPQPDTDSGFLSYSCTASPSWFSAVVPGRRKNKSRTFSLDGIAVGAVKWNRGRGMSPTRQSGDDENDDDHCRGASSGYSSESCRRTPRRAGRRGGGLRDPSHSRNISGMAFCFSPLIRPSPNRHWSQKGGVPPDAAVFPGEPRPVPSKLQISSATSLNKNRSRKLADFGRYSHDGRH